MSWQALSGGVLRRASVSLAVAVVAAIAAQPAAAKPKPDLEVASISAGAAEVAAGSELSVEDTVENTGAARADRSTTRFYLSSDRVRGGGDVRLRGKRLVGRLGSGKDSSGESELAVPLQAPPGDRYLIGCADDRREVKERREGNNCLATDDAIAVLPEDCTDRLTALGIDFEFGPSMAGVADPVTVETPINGITYSSYGSDTNNPDLYMDCTLALALHDMAGEMSARGLTHVEHIGIYNYRCIGEGTPPDCTNGISQHAYATAIDIAELRSTGETYNVNDDWVIDPNPEATCTAPTEGEKDTLLHGFACSLYAAGTFRILLTPNYNAAHRNHFHLDLTPGSSFIARLGHP